MQKKHLDVVPQENYIINFIKVISKKKKKKNL